VITQLYQGFDGRADLVQAHLAAWEFLGSPGAQLTGAQKSQIVAEARASHACATCKARREALSPGWVNAPHESDSELPEPWVDVVHRIATDPGRMTKQFVDELAEQGLDHAAYVELLGTTMFALSVDIFHRAVGLEPLPLPDVVQGPPSGERASIVDDIGAWLPVLSPKSPEAPAFWKDLPRLSHVARGISLVPSQILVHAQLIAAQYVPFKAVPSTSNMGRALSRAQIELVAGRVSAISECFY